MATVRLSLGSTDSEVVQEIGELTGLRRTRVIRTALAAYRWVVQQAISGSTILARKPSGDEVTLTTPELQRLEGKGRKLSPKELGLLAKRLEKLADPAEAARIKEQMTRGFYGI